MKDYSEQSRVEYPFFVPQDPIMREDLLNVDRKTKEELRLRHRLFIDRDFEANTIATIMVESLIGTLHSYICENGVSILSEDNGNGINFYNLLEIYASNKKNESAEKTGNINVIFRPGNNVKAIINDDISPDQKDHEIQFIAIDAAYAYPDDQNHNSVFVSIDRVARKRLSDRYNILLNKPFMAIATAYLFLENLYRQLIQKLVLTGKKSVMINFNDIIEFHATKMADNTVDVRLRPGMQAKLIIKSDDATEDEDDGSYDNY